MVIVNDCRKHTILSSHPDVVSGEMVFLAFAPLVTKDNYVIGCVGIDDIKSRADFGLIVIHFREQRFHGCRNQSN